MSTTSIESTTTVSSKEQEDENPFVGLRPFEAEESFLFFGRSKQTTELLQKLYTTRFIGVVGSSGCGKSSLIKAGLVPILKAGFLTNERDKWIIAKMRPAGNPLLFLAEALGVALNSSEFIRDNNNQPSDYKTSFLKEIHEKGAQGIIDILIPEFEKTPCNLLLLVDQFEELFTTRRNDADAETQMNENVIFVNILLSLSRQKVLPVYVVITMRSDYIGNCNKYYGLPEILNEGQYLVPRLNRQQLREVIELPIKLYGEKISARLLDQVLNDSDKDLDQLPVLQHALMRTHKFWIEEKKTNAIDFANYEKAGKLDKALSNHANEVYEKLDSTQKKIAELVFRSLTDVNADNDPIRRRQSLEQLTEVCNTLKNVSAQQVEEVINKFRDSDCAFLTPFIGKLKPTTIIDISHESLMRQWDKLKEWMKEEQTSGRKFKWLTESVSNNREFLRGIDLSDALIWKAKQPANEQWASRYLGNYKVVENYINNSKKSARKNKYLKNAIIGIFIIAPVALYALYHNYDKKIDNERIKEAQEFKDRLENKNQILNKSLVKLNSSLVYEEKLQDSLKTSFEEQRQMRIKQFYSDMEAERQKNENERKERILEQEAINRQEIEGLTTRLKHESFYDALYKENNQSFVYGDAVVNALIDTYKKNRNEYNNFYQA